MLGAAAASTAGAIALKWSAATRGRLVGGRGSLVLPLGSLDGAVVDMGGLRTEDIITGAVLGGLAARGSRMQQKKSWCYARRCTLSRRKQPLAATHGNNPLWGCCLSTSPPVYCLQANVSCQTSTLVNLNAKATSPYQIIEPFKDNIIRS